MFSLLRRLMANIALQIVSLAILIGLVGVAYAVLPGIISTAEIAPGATVSNALFAKIKTNLEDLDARVSASSSVPAGAVMAFNLETCPSGWIAMNGSSGTIDMRGEFIRGLDNGRGVDIGRALASWQDASRVAGAGGNPTPPYLINGAWHYADGVGTTPLAQANTEDWITVHTTGGNWLQGFTGYTSVQFATMSFGKVRPRNRAFLYSQKS